MDGQIDVTGILGQEETTTSQEIEKPETTSPVTKPSVDQTYYGRLPSTNEYKGAYLLGLGTTLCLIVLILYQLHKRVKVS